MAICYSFTGQGQKKEDIQMAALDGDLRLGFRNQGLNLDSMISITEASMLGG
jgi:hypothetical protein